MHAFLRAASYLSGEEIFTGLEPSADRPVTVRPDFTPAKVKVSGLVPHRANKPRMGRPKRVLVSFQTMFFGNSRELSSPGSERSRILSAASPGSVLKQI